jgi:L-lactate dehydrogenase complex protein LldF
MQFAIAETAPWFSSRRRHWTNGQHFAETHIVMMAWSGCFLLEGLCGHGAGAAPQRDGAEDHDLYLRDDRPAREGEADGPRETHVIILDNGRSALLGDPEFREILHCIRCGACLNACPVYRQIGGHAYRSVYSGPIGAVLTPLLQPGERSELVYASSLCGACSEACPVKIPLHDMLVHLRRKNVEAGAVPWPERMGFRMYAALFESPGRYRAAGRMARSVQRMILGGDRQPWRRCYPCQGWAKCRALPAAGKKAFRDIWSEEQKGK